MTELEAKAKDCIENHTHKLVDKPTKQDIYLREESIFISGYKLGATENGIQWHDLRKDPNDLPKGQINRFLFAYVKNMAEKKPMLVCYNGEWFYDANTYNDEVKVIEWCEIPQFKE